MSKVGCADDDDADRRMYEAAVAKQRARFRALVEHAPSAIATLDAAGRFEFLSPSVEDIFGYRPEALAGEDAFEYIHPADRERIERTFERGLEEPEGLLTAEYRFRHADGQWLHVESRGHNRLHDPAVEGFVVNTRDVTAERRATTQLQRERDLNRQLLEVAPHPMIVVDHEGVVKRANEAARTQFGMTTDEVVGLHHDSDEVTVRDADGEPLSEDETVSARVVETGEPVRGETIECTGPYGNQFRVTLSGAPLTSNGGVTHVVLSFEDITPL